MATTLLQATNALLKQVGEIAGSSGELSSLTDAARQVAVDVAVSSLNETTRELLRTGTLASETAEGTLTLVSGQSSYSFSSDLSVTDFEKMAGNPVDVTNEDELTEYPGGWLALRVDRKDRADYTGLPRHWTINTTNGNLEIDTQPTADEDGRAYTFLYEKRINLSVAADTFPVSDSAVDEIVLAASEVWRRKRRKDFDEGLFQAGISTAADFARKTPKKTFYGFR